MQLSRLGGAVQASGGGYLYDEPGDRQQSFSGVYDSQCGFAGGTEETWGDGGRGGQDGGCASVKDVVEFRKPAKEVGKEAPEFHRVNFSRLSDRLDVLLMLLPPNPAFDLNGDFKERYPRRCGKSAAMRSNSLKANSRPRGFSRLRRFPMNIMNMPFPEIRPCRWKRICCWIGICYIHLTARSFTKADENAVLQR